MPIFARPPVADIYRMLARYRALIVHFSGTPKGAGSSYDDLYPDDLKKVLVGECHGGLSCSTVMPGDEFEHLDRANATGCIGVVLGLASPQSLLDARSNDCGSAIADGVREFQHARDMTLNDLEQTILGRSRETYNEWGVADYVVLGMFAAPPYQIWRRYAGAELVDMPEELQEGVEAPGYTSARNVEATFAGLPVYSFQSGQLVRYESGAWAPVDHEDVYAD